MTDGPTYNSRAARILRAGVAGSPTVWTPEAGWTDGVAPARRDWLSVGEAVLVQYGIEPARVEAEAARLEWRDAAGTTTLPAMPGMAIRKIVTELRIPKVSMFAINGVLEGPEYALSVYGIEGNYTGERVRVHVLDQGSVLTPIFADVYPA